MHYLRSLWAVQLLPQLNAKMADGEQRAKRITGLVLQSATNHQRVVENRIVEDGRYLHELYANMEVRSLCPFFETSGTRFLIYFMTAEFILSSG